jgi:hypothetical protein
MSAMPFVQKGGGQGVTKVVPFAHVACTDFASGRTVLLYDQTVAFVPSALIVWHPPTTSARSQLALSEYRAVLPFNEIAEQAFA